MCDRSRSRVRRDGLALADEPAERRRIAIVQPAGHVAGDLAAAVRGADARADGGGLHVPGRVQRQDPEGRVGPPLAAVRDDHLVPLTGLRRRWRPDDQGPEIGVEVRQRPDRHRGHVHAEVRVLRGAHEDRRGQRLVAATSRCPRRSSCAPRSTRTLRERAHGVDQAADVLRPGAAGLDRQEAVADGDLRARPDDVPTACSRGPRPISRSCR